MSQLQLGVFVFISEGRKVWVRVNWMDGLMVFISLMKACKVSTEPHQSIRMSSRNLLNSLIGNIS